MNLTSRITMKLIHKVLDYVQVAISTGQREWGVTSLVDWLCGRSCTMHYTYNNYGHQGHRQGQGFGGWSPPSSAKTTLKAPPSLMTVFSLGITGID